MNLDIEYFKKKLREITDWYENTRWNKKALLEKITELNTELTYTEEKIVSDMIHLRNKMQLSHNERFDSYYRI